MTMTHYRQPRGLALASRSAVYAPPPGAPARRRRRRELVVTAAVMALLPLVALGIVLGAAGWLR